MDSESAPKLIAQLLCVFVDCTWGYNKKLCPFIGKLHLFCPWIGCFFIGQAQEIVYTDVMILGQRRKNLRRHHALTTFIIGVGPLWHIDLLAHLGLC